MHCEGDKTYDEPGDCPVCGMHLKKEETKSVPGNKQTIYTCPMHPEVKQDHPAAAQNAEWISFLKKRMQAARKIIPTK
ncbi:lead, cadmium, zinc and mercury transporting ATPase [Geofilum rubicundum JCM 15548]|uniref:Lead, cadmium, zinc and mercury transporting ATPase n=2 Tax=Geofilum TaxID=1236988 RepID=A0A0E9LZW5_9BACT|nr:lead, cadmium, zinc and mercury transporting ATPase [Geofilum rubicundum JCM 15548]